MLITESELRAAIISGGYKPPKDIARITTLLNDAMEKYEINNPQRISYALAHFIFETAGFNKFKEDDNSSHTYLKRKKYYPYVGRGIPHLTWRENYRAYTEYRQKQFNEYCADVDFLKHPENLEYLENAIDCGGWYWAIFAKLNDDADKKEFTGTCLKLNGPRCNTIDQRRQIMLRIKKIKGWL